MAERAEVPKAEGAVVDLMAALEQSVKDARAAAQTARERRRAERVHATYGCDDPEVCIAKGLHGDVE